MQIKGAFYRGTSRDLVLSVICMPTLFYQVYQRDAYMIEMHQELQTEMFAPLPFCWLIAKISYINRMETSGKSMLSMILFNAARVKDIRASQNQKCAYIYPFLFSLSFSLSPSLPLSCSMSLILAPSRFRLPFGCRWRYPGIHCDRHSTLQMYLGCTICYTSRPASRDDRSADSRSLGTCPKGPTDWKQ